MSDRTSQPFKQYQRGRRIQTPDESFSKGMAFTRTPLDESLSRLLVNYDLLYDGDALTPRKGFRPSMIGLPFDAGDFQSKLTGDITANKCSDSMEEDNRNYRQVIVAEISEEDQPVAGTNLYPAPTEFWAIESDPLAVEYDCLPGHGVKCRNRMALPISYGTYPLYDSSRTYMKGDRIMGEDQSIYECLENNVTGAWDASKWALKTPPKSYYYIPSECKAHGIPITRKLFLADPVGCFAWDDNYYNFNTEGKMVRSRYYPAEGLAPAYYVSEELKPYELSCAEALTSGFNLCQSNPYAFTDSYQGGKIDFQGFMFYKKGTVDFSDPASLASPLVLNSSYVVRAYFTVEQGAKYKLEFSYGSSTGDMDSFQVFDVQEYEAGSGDAPPPIITENFKCQYESGAIVIKAYRWNGSAYDDMVEMYSAAGFTCVKTPMDSTANRVPPSYDMSKVRGMVYWKKYLWAYGHPEAKSTLFRSALNEPTYFPYPQGIDIYDEPIVAVVPFNESLLVFTRAKVIQLTLSTDGTGWFNKVLQGNMNFSEFDSRFIQVIKNMVFFKSGDYYYMIVPKTLSVQNELAIAPISKNITYFLDDFMENCKNLVDIVYNYTGSLELVNHYNFLDYEDVHNVYTFATDKESVYLSIVLLYNTVDRTWRSYTFESQGTFYPLRQDATNQTELMMPMHVLMDGAEANGIQFVDRHEGSNKDLYIPYWFEFTSDGEGHWGNPLDGSDQTAEDIALDIEFNAIHVFRANTLLDTGYRNETVDLKKRYRELQIKFNNVSGSDLKFSTEFLIDGETRINAFRYDVLHDINPESDDYGYLYIDRIPVENIELPGHTILGTDDLDNVAWTLDNSNFPEIAFWKVRLKVSGKGYTPRFRIAGFSEENYELLGYTWVYRLMYSR